MQLTSGLTAYSRENTVLRGQLFEPREDDPTALTVRNDVYVIPNALVADHFVPDPPTSTDISELQSPLPLLSA